MTPDNHYLAFYEVHPETQRDIWILDMEKGEIISFLVTPDNERAPVFSPDGRWIAYVSDETGRDEVFIKSYLDSGRKWQISINGGTEPVWRKDGLELFYRRHNKLIAVNFESQGRFDQPNREILFEGYYQKSPWGIPYYDYDSVHDRFLMVQTDWNTLPGKIEVTLN